MDFFLISFVSKLPTSSSKFSTPLGVELPIIMQKYPMMKAMNTIGILLPSQYQSLAYVPDVTGHD